MRRSEEMGQTKGGVGRACRGKRDDSGRPKKGRRRSVGELDAQSKEEDQEFLRICRPSDKSLLWKSRGRSRTQSQSAREIREWNRTDYSWGRKETEIRKDLSNRSRTNVYI